MALEPFQQQFFYWLSPESSSNVWGWVLIGAYLGGVVSTLLPCSVAMLPILVGYVGGLAETRSPGVMTAHIGLFVVGVSITLSVLGTVAAVLGLTFGAWVGPWSQWLVAVLSFLIGGQLLGWWHVSLPQWLSKLPGVEGASSHRHPIVRALLPVGLGMVYGAASSPCGTPYLAGILTLIGQTQQVAFGALALFIYGLGQGTLLLLAGLFTGVLKRLAVLRQVGSVLNGLSGWVFVALALFFALNALGVIAYLEPVLNAWLLSLGGG